MINKLEIHKKICEQLHETYQRKNTDYGSSFEKTRNMFENAFLIRAYDKLHRIETILGGKKPLVVDESLVDTILDLANYCIMEVVEMSSHQNEKTIMTPEEYQNLAMRTATPKTDIINCALGLTGESGEFAELVKKANFQEHPFNKEEAIKELGDSLWYIAVAAKKLGVPLSDVMKINIEKLKQRYPEGFDKQKSINRKE